MRYPALKMLTLLVLATLAVACSKKKQSYHLWWTYEPTPGIPSYAQLSRFSFASDVPAGKATHWDFGDGSISDDAKPQHTYSGLRTYTVTLTVNGDAANKVVSVIDVAKNILPHTISYTGARLRDSALRFTTNVLPDSNFYWIFGDGATATTPGPVHTYTANGNYVVSLRVNGNTATMCYLAVNIIDPPANTAALARLRTWHDTIFTHFSSEPTPHVMPRADMTFAPELINPLQLRLLGYQLEYDEHQGGDSVLSYGTSYVNGTGRTATVQLQYYRRQDSIVVRRSEQVSAAAIQWETWTTP